jgi:hypothetical protein
MKLTKYTLPEDGGIRAIELHPGGLLARLGSRDLLLDTTAKKPSPISLVVPEISGSSPHLPSLSTPVLAGGFVGDRLVVLCGAVEQPGYPPQLASVRSFDRSGSEVARFDAPGAEWLWIDAQQRIILHGQGRSTAHDPGGAVLADLGPSFAVPSPDGRHVARKAGEQIEISGDSSRTLEGAHFAWIDAHHLALRSPMDSAELLRVDIRNGAATSLGPSPKPTAGVFADEQAVWIVRKGGTAQTKVATIHRFPLDGQAPEQIEIPGGKSETSAALAAGRLAVAVNWQKAVFLVDP